MIAALGLGVGACSGDSEPTSHSRAPEPSSSEAASAPTVGDERTAPTEQGRPTAGGLTWQAEAPLVARRPANTMRAAEYGVQGHDDATLAVFFFGHEQGGGGSVGANIARWLGQLEQPDGRSTEAVAKRSEREINGVRVTSIDAKGTFVGQLGMGTPVERRPGWRVLGAIAAGPQGLVFFKLLGPEAAVDEAEGAFERLIESLQPM